MANMIKLRRGTAATMPSLALGELVFTTDTKKLYVGDGVTALLVGPVDAQGSFIDTQPIGAILAWPSATVPTGYLECNGQTVSRTVYSLLFAIIGTTYGAGDGSTTFKVPDLRGEFIRGWDHGRGVDASRAIGTAQADELRSHRHAITLQDSGAWSTIPEHSDGKGGVSTGYTEYTGGSETRPRNIALMYIIKASYSYASPISDMNITDNTSAQIFARDNIFPNNRISSADGTTADTPFHGSTFSYAAGTPYRGPIVSFGGLGGSDYALQLNASYNNSTQIAFRTRNGDSATWNPWRELIHTENVDNYVGPFRSVAGNTVLISAPTERVYTTPQAGKFDWTTCKQFRVKNAGTYKVYFEYKGGGGHARVNGGVLQWTVPSNSSYAGYSGNITVGAGDTIYIQYKSNTAGQYATISMYIRNASIRYGGYVTDSNAVLQD
jgi:microcystin-dependent protein